MAATKTGPKSKRKIDFKHLTELAGLGCPIKECATHLEVSERTLLRNSEAMAVYYASLDTLRKTLRRLQIQTARGCETVFLRDKDGEIVKGDRGRAVILKPGSAPNERMQEHLGIYLLDQNPKLDITSGGEKLKPWTKTQLQIPAAPNTVATQELDPATPEKN